MNERELRDQERRESQTKRINEEVATLESIKFAIKPLQFEPFEQGVVESQKTRRNIITADGEIVGRVTTLSVYSMRSDRRYRFSSPRIPRNNQRDYRDYKKLDSLAAAIVKFCMPVTDDERRANVLRGEMRYYEGRKHKAWSRARGVLSFRALRWHDKDERNREVADYNTPRFDAVIQGLADRNAETEALLRVMVNKKRVYDRFAHYVDFVYLNGRRAELSRLDLSNEKIHNI